MRWKENKTVLEGLKKKRMTGRRFSKQTSSDTGRKFALLFTVKVGAGGTGGAGVSDGGKRVKGGTQFSRGSRAEQRDTCQDMYVRWKKKKSERKISRKGLRKGREKR